MASSDGGINGIEGSIMEILAGGDAEVLCRPCVDCGVRTGSFCDFCEAADRIPSEEWAEGQMTPLCTICDGIHDECHFCRDLPWCTPPTQPFHSQQREQETVQARLPREEVSFVMDGIGGGARPSPTGCPALPDPGGSAVAHAADGSPPASFQKDVEPNLSCVFLVMDSFNAAPLPEQFVTLKEGTFALQLGEGPEDWVRVKRLGDACNLGDGKEGLVPTFVLSPVPVEQYAQARSVLQPVLEEWHKRHCSLCSVWEEAAPQLVLED